MNKSIKVPVLKFKSEIKVKRAACPVELSDDLQAMLHIAHVVVGHLKNKKGLTEIIFLHTLSLLGYLSPLRKQHLFYFAHIAFTGHELLYQPWFQLLHIFKQLEFQDHGHGCKDQQRRLHKA